MIRELAVSDREPLRSLISATGVFTETETGIAMELIDAVLSNPQHPDYIIRTSEEDGKVDGYYCVGPTPGTEGTFDLYWIAVDPAKQGAGIGARLDEHATELIRLKGGRLIVAETSSRPNYQKTREFYGRRNYSVVARVADYYRPGDDLVVFGKYLKTQGGGK